MATQGDAITKDNKVYEETYNVSLLVTPAAPELEVTCGVCLDLLRKPQLTECCGHHFCQECLELVQASTKLCPLCKDPDVKGMLNKGLQRQIRALAIYCPYKSHGCSWTGEVRTLDSHLMKGEREGGCLYIKVPCRNTGCGMLIERYRLRRHEQAECSRYLSINLADLNHRVECLEKENAELKLTVKQLQQCQSSDALLIASLQAEIETLKQAVNVATPTTTPTTIVQNVASIFPSPVVDSLLPLPKRTVPYQFMFTDYSSRSVSTEMWFCEPFYTHANGYKFVIRVAAEGLGNGRTTHISVHAYLMRGEHDDSLKWPFRGVLTLQLLNQLRDECHHEQISEFNDRTPAQYCSRSVYWRAWHDSNTYEALLYVHVYAYIQGR